MKQFSQLAVFAVSLSLAGCGGSGQESTTGGTSTGGASAGGTAANGVAGGSSSGGASTTTGGSNSGGASTGGYASGELRPLGAPCSVDSECSSKGLPYPARCELKWPGGYCTSDCTTVAFESKCGDHGYCGRSSGEPISDDEVGYCLAWCGTELDACRPEYYCHQGASDVCVEF